MTDQKKEIAELLAGKVEALEAEEIENMIEIPPEGSMGDYAFPCFRLAKSMRRAPNQIAQELAEQLRGDGRFSDVRNVNAYVNFFLNREHLTSDVVSEVLKKGKRYGGSDLLERHDCPGSDFGKKRQQRNSCDYRNRDYDSAGTYGI